MLISLSDNITVYHFTIQPLPYPTLTLPLSKAYLFATLGFSCLAFVIGALTQWIPVYVVRASKLANPGNPYSNERLVN